MRQIIGCLVVCRKGGQKAMNNRGNVRLTILLVGLLVAAGMLACQTGGGAPPTAQITFPPTGRQVAVGVQVPIHSISQDDRGISRVELWIGGQLVETTTASGTDRTFVAVQHWTASAAGVVNIGVRAYDSDGQASEPALVTVQVVATAADVTDPLPEAPEPPTGPVQGTTPVPEAPSPVPDMPTPVPGAPVDLAIWNLTLSKLNPAPGEQIVVGVTILNSGGTEARDFRWGWDPGTGEEPIHSEPISSLSPGDDVVQEMRYTYQQVGDYTGHAWADSYDAYDELDETNNVAWEDVSVGGAVGVEQADLETGNCGYPPPARVGQPVPFGLIIWNSGTVEASNFRWGIQPASGMDFVESQETITLAPNEDRWFDWQGDPIIYDQPGQYTAVMMVDLHGQVDEANDNNNQCQIQVTVEDGGGAAAEELVLHALTGQSGHLSVGMGGTHVVNPGVVVGDDAGNGQRKGFLFFDISWIPDGATVESATLNLSSRQREGNPPADLGALRVYYGNYGDLDSSDWDAQSFQAVSLESGTEIGHNVDVTDSVATARANIWYYQLRLEFVEATDGDGREDSLEFNTDEGGVVLRVNYTQ
jgi:hypothetical protein